MDAVQTGAAVRLGGVSVALVMVQVEGRVCRLRPGDFRVPGTGTGETGQRQVKTDRDRQSQREKQTPSLETQGLRPRRPQDRAAEPEPADGHGKREWGRPGVS